MVGFIATGGNRGAYFALAFHWDMLLENYLGLDWCTLERDNWLVGFPVWGSIPSERPASIVPVHGKSIVHSAVPVAINSIIFDLIIEVLYTFFKCNTWCK